MAVETKDQADLQRRIRDYRAMYGFVVWETDERGEIVRVLSPENVLIKEPEKIWVVKQ